VTHTPTVTSLHTSQLEPLSVVT